MPDYQAIKVQSQSQTESLCIVPYHHASVITRPGTQGDAFVALRYVNDKYLIRSGLVMVSTIRAEDEAELSTPYVQLETQLVHQYESRPQDMYQILQRKNLENVAVSALYRQKNGNYQAFFCLQGRQAIAIVNKNTGALKHQFSTEGKKSIRRFKAQVQPDDLIIHFHQDAWSQMNNWLTPDRNPPIEAALNHASVNEIGTALAQTFNQLPQSNLIALMAVPDYGYELVRTYVERPELRVKLLRKILDMNMSSAQILGYLEQLQSEKCSSMPMGQKTTDEAFIQPYSTVKTPFIQNVLDLQEITQACHTAKKSARLLKVVDYFQGLNFEEMSNYFDALILYDDIYNTHQYPKLDRFFGIQQTSSWSHAIKQIRSLAVNKLFAQIEGLRDEEQIRILEEAKKRAIFKLHRHNSIFAGAYGKTATVHLIEKKIKELRGNSASLPLKLSS
ncbi:MAG: hypothetical protein BGO90_06725 [Legionella sp. 40-6]|nr:MAG: hypothetical protein BGO90_06725 [Legionella sp. 40-6]